MNPMGPRGGIGGNLELDPERARTNAPGALDPMSVTGRRIKLKTQGLEPNLLTQPTELISARSGVPMQWLITLMPAVKGDSGVLPWVNTFDGGVNAPNAGGTIYTAPRLQDDVTGKKSLQVSLRWGAGGASWETKFDYPGVGCAFGLTADTVDLNVAIANAALFATQGAVPIVGAFMVPGQASDPSPLRWAEETQGIATTVTRFWGIKPYARRLRVRVPAPGALVLPPKLTWIAVDNTPLVVENLTLLGTSGAADAHVDGYVSVPSQAVAVAIKNPDAASVTVFLEWEIGLV